MVKFKGNRNILLGQKGIGPVVNPNSDSKIKSVKLST